MWDLTKSRQGPYLHDVPNGLSYAVDVIALVQTVIVSPHAPAIVLDTVQELLRKCGYETIQVVKSGYTGYGHLLPSADEIGKYSSK